MWLLKNRSRGFYLCFVLLLTLTIGSSAIAYASSRPSTATLKAGGLTESPPNTPVSVQVQKKARLVSYSLLITAIDARGSGAGWNLAITSTTFAMTNGKQTDTLPANASQITGVNLSCDAHSACTKPVNSLSYPLLVPAGNPPPPAVKFFDAAVSSGLGKFFLTMMVNVAIPTNTKAGTYTSTITLAITNGP